MSYYNYAMSQRIVRGDPPFYALIMAAMWKADSRNFDLLKEAWPEVWAEFIARYDAPAGRLAGEEKEPLLRSQFERARKP